MKSAKDIEKDFKSFSSWEDKYKYIIDLGKTLKPFDDDLKIEDNIVKGCQSQVWLVASLGENKKINFKADSDAIIVKGLLVLVLAIYNGLSAAEVISTEPSLLKNLDLAEHLSPSRSNGLVAMIKQIKFYGLGFQALEG